MYSTLPALIIGLIMLTYWLRVMQLVQRTKKVAGHHANLIPEEKLGRMLRIVWFPVIILWIAIPLLFATGAGRRIAILRPITGLDLLQWPALFIALAAYALTWVCWFRMGKSWRMGIDPNDKTQLVFSGPFAYVRHPIYCLSQLMMVMTFLIVPAPLMLVIATLHLILMQWEVRREELYLSALHGPSYVRYQRHVGRFIPRSLRAYRP